MSSNDENSRVMTRPNKLSFMSKPAAPTRLSEYEPPYRVVIKVSGMYHVVASDAPDDHDPYPTKLEAMIAARKEQFADGLDPSAVYDLTNAEPGELARFLR